MRYLSRPAKKFFVTSAPFACGVGWLVNALIELDLKGTSVAYKDDNWEKLQNGNWTVSLRAREHMLNHLPATAGQREFPFRQKAEFFWEHRISFPNPRKSPVIVVVRDPRDAIFSLHRRWKANGWIAADYLEFLQQPSDWPDHFPRLFYTRPLTTYLLFYLIWLKTKQFRPVLFVRFEDIKAKPECVLREVFNFLKLPQPTRAQLDLAIKSSSVANAKRVMEGSTIGGSHQMGAINKGEVKEWEQTYEPSWLEHFAQPQVEILMAMLGYPTAQGSGVVDTRSLSLLTEKRVRSLRDRFADWMCGRIESAERPEFLEKLNRLESWWTLKPGRLRYNFELRTLAAFWARAWSGGRAPRQEAEMRAFFYRLIQILMTAPEQDFALRKTEAETEIWSEAAIARELTQFYKLNAP